MKSAPPWVTPMQNVSSLGQCHTKSARQNLPHLRKKCPPWSTLHAKFAPPGTILTQKVPSLGQPQRK